MGVGLETGVVSGIIQRLASGFRLCVRMEYVARVLLLREAYDVRFEDCSSRFGEGEGWRGAEVDGDYASNVQAEYSVGARGGGRGDAPGEDLHGVSAFGPDSEARVGSSLLFILIIQ